MLILLILHTAKTRIHKISWDEYELNHTHQAIIFYIKTR